MLVVRGVVVAVDAALAEHTPCRGELTELALDEAAQPPAVILLEGAQLGDRLIEARAVALELFDDDLTALLRLREHPARALLRLVDESLVHRLRLRGQAVVLVLRGREQLVVAGLRRAQQLLRARRRVADDLVAATRRVTDKTVVLGLALLDVFVVHLLGQRDETGRVGRRGRRCSRGRGDGGGTGGCLRLCRALLRRLDLGVRRRDPLRRLGLDPLGVRLGCGDPLCGLRLGPLDLLGDRLDVRRRRGCDGG